MPMSTLAAVRSATTYDNWVDATNQLVERCTTDTHPGVHTHQRSQQGVTCITCGTLAFECALAPVAIFWASAGRPVIRRTTQGVN